MISTSKTKIIATLGPSSKDKNIIEKMIRNGARGFRINFSHGDQAQWSDFVNTVRMLEQSMETPLALIGDLQGPNIRLGNLPQQSVFIKKGMIYEVTLSQTSDDVNKIPVPTKEFFDKLVIGDTIQVGDNMLSLKVIEKKENVVYTEALSSGEIKSRMSIRIKDKDIDVPYMTSKDKQDLLFAVKNNFSHIMISFVRTEKDVLCVKNTLKEVTEDPPRILAKIETRSAVEHLEEIVRASDGVVVARGDLGKVFPLEYLPELQSRIVSVARRRGKPVYIATQLLTSMVDSPIPTRSEVVDVYVSVKEGVDGVMLTNETSIGKYPAETVEWAKRIIDNAERNPEVNVYPEVEDLSWRFGRGIIELSTLLESPIIIYSLTGKAMRISSAYRPRYPLFIGSPNWSVLRDCAILYGCIPIHIDSNEYEEGLEKLKARLKEMEMLKEGTLTISSYKFTHLDKQKITIEKI
ncbi:MAG: pyruvate kinase [Fervidicoccaceae archaeon]